jgi:cytochrome c oxidase subunit 2
MFTTWPAAVAAVAAVAGCGAAAVSDPPLSPAAEAGREVMRANGCASCHGRDGEGGAGPTWVGLSGSTVRFDDGSTATADAAYLYEAIADPGAREVAGYGFPMPQNSLDDEQIQSVIAYIEALSEPEAGS